jgi:hypothetical protein
MHLSPGLGSSTPIERARSSPLFLSSNEGTLHPRLHRMCNCS